MAKFASSNPGGRHMGLGWGTYIPCNPSVREGKVCNVVSVMFPSSGIVQVCMCITQHNPPANMEYKLAMNDLPVLLVKKY